MSVMITGACGDIGLALAREFICAGYRRLALCDLLEETEALGKFEALRGPNSEVLYRQVDVANADDVARFVNEADSAYGGLDICIGNAGIVERGCLLDLPPDAWRRTIEVNLTGCFLTAQAAGRVMRSRGRGGQIVFIGSWVQDVPREGIGAYCASKGGLKMLAKCLALELGPLGIRVNVVAPGFVDAGLTARNLEANPQRRPAMEQSIPLGRLIPAHELARAVRMLCSIDGAYVTGATLLIDGGASLFFRGAKDK